MSRLVTYAIIIALSVIVWLHWGGLSNDMGTLVIATADALIATAIYDKRKAAPIEGSESE